MTYVAMVLYLLGVLPTMAWVGKSEISSGSVALAGIAWPIVSLIFLFYAVPLAMWRALR